MRENSKMIHENIRQISFVIMLVAVAVLMVYELSYFVSSALGGFTLYMLLRKPHRYLVARGWNTTLASGAIVMGTVLLVFGAGGGFLGTIISKVADFRPQIVIDNVNSIHDFVLQKTGYNIFSENIADKAISSLGNIAPRVFNATGSIVINGFMALVLLFFMLQADQKMDRALTGKLPLSQESIRLVRRETHDMVVSNAIGIPVVMLGQGLAAGLAYWLLGAGDPIVWGLITGFFGLVPVVGTAAVWLPLAINLIATGGVWQGVVLMLFGMLVVSNIDNMLRIVLLKKYADVHPVITIFGIILGMNLFGFWGIIFGPLMISGFLLMIRIYHNEFLDEGQAPADTLK